jgi:hypothetical protein
MENWGLMINSWRTQLMRKTSLMGLAMKENLRAIRMRRPRRKMASRMTSRRKRRQQPRSPLALLAGGHSALI